MEDGEINYKNIAAQPDIISKIIKIDAETKHCFQEMDNLLRSDQSAASLILRVANSPVYNRGRHIKTLPFAISLLGINVIRSLAILALSRSVFTQSNNLLIRDHIWRHSLLTAIASQTICSELGSKKEGEEAFIAGLLHDIGKVLLFSHRADAYIQALNYALNNNCSSAEAEQKFMGIDHYKVGRQAIKVWKLPEQFMNYAGANLDVLSPEQIKDTVQRSLAIANSLIKGAGIGASPWNGGLRKKKLEAFGLSNEFIDYLLEDTFLQGLMANEIYQQCT